MRICRPVVNKVKQAAADYYASDCPMGPARTYSAAWATNGRDGAQAPLSLLRRAYGI